MKEYPIVRMFCLVMNMKKREMNFIHHKYFIGIIELKYLCLNMI